MCRWDVAESNCDEAGILDCELQAVCPRVLRYLDTSEGREVSFDAEAADCVLASLRTGERAVHDFGSIVEVSEGGVGHGYTLQVLGDGTALVSYQSFGDVDGTEEMVWIELPEPDCLDSCGKSGDAFERCLADLMALPCPIGEPVCG